jgi:carbon dioxide concentrating mechanism protein CcmN
VAVPAQALNSLTNGSIQGDVDLALGVTIASGVLLGAAPGCRLVISSGVCLGADVVVQARQGDLVLEPGVSLGSGVLVIGHGSIGQHTCIGANSTLINPALGACQVVAPGSLVGDPSQASVTQGESPRGSNVVANGSGHGVNGSATLGYPVQAEGLATTPLSGQAPNGQAPNGQAPNGQAPNGGGQTGNGATVYGKTQVNRLLDTLFPHRQALNGASPEDRP